MIKTDLQVSPPNILKYYANSTWNAIAVRVDDTGVAADANGRKIVPAGSIVGGKVNPVLTNRNEPVDVKADGKAEGVLLYDVDVTNGISSDGAMITQGYINLTHLPIAPTALVIDALPKIIFMD